MFANPTACHYVAQMQNLPVLTVIYNNALYNAVRRATLDMYGDGVAARGRWTPACRSAPAELREDRRGARRPWRTRRAARRSAGGIASRSGGRARRTAGTGERDMPALMPDRLATRVLIVGGGPVGTTLAMDLAWRGIDVIVAEQRHRGEPPSVKCNHVAARTMEIFRRLGVARVRARCRHAARLCERYSVPHHRRPASSSARIKIPCRRDRYTAKDGPDGWWPTPEPPHRINQILPGAVAGRICRRQCRACAI